MRSSAVRLKAISGSRQRQPLHHVGDGGALDALRLHEFQPRRRGVEQVAHLDTRARRKGRRLELRLATAIDGDFVGITSAFARGFESTSLATAPIEGSASPRKPSVTIAERSSSASFEVAWRSTARARSSAPMPEPSSADADQPQAAAGDRDIDAARAGVDRVLDQLLDDAGRSLDDLTRGDAVDEVRRQLTDGHLMPHSDRRRGTGGSAFYPILLPAGRTGRRPKDAPARMVSSMKCIIRAPSAVSSS